ncbi:MAG: O-antigen ligase family protein [Clostridiales bacterium]|nr:O-antigen ligase family protein [Clostridiales bacterium]
MQKVRDFLISKYFLIAVVLLACAITISGMEYAGVIIFAVLILAILALTDDLLATTLPFLLLCTFSLKCFDSFDRFVKYVPIAIPAVAVFVFHFVKYKKHFTIGKSFWGILATSIAVTLGGFGKITAAEYFSLTAIYYTIGLGFGMLGIYMVINAYFEVNERYSLRERFSQIMALVGAFASFMVLEHYLVHIRVLIRDPGILDFQWRNNIATVLMLSLPFPFYLSQRKHFYIWFGILSYICMLLSGSRGGLIFGTIEFMLCVVIILIYDKKHRKANKIILIVLAAIGLIVSPYIFAFVSKTLDRVFNFNENKIRLQLYARAVEDFKSNPIFGRGLGYMGNRDVHPSRKFSLCWYHSSPFQIIGSFGIVGVLGYAIQWAVRIRIFESKRSLFNTTLFISFIGMEMMSLVNPGIFCPVPYLLMVNMMFIIMEKCNEKQILK